MRVLVTGASGLLGRAVYKTLIEERKYQVVGTAKTRATGDLQQLDLIDKEAVETFIDKHKPQVIVHCAAERRPDVAEKDHDGTLKLNVQVPAHLATIAKNNDILLIYISTDYVFDGKNPPYEVDASPNPLNFYGESKYKGEVAIQNVNPDAAILRIPILYGDVEYNSESAVNILLDPVQNNTKKINMDHYAIRYPTNVDDIARVIKDLAVKHVEQSIPIKGIFHFSAQQAFTKYEICAVFAEILRVPIDHLNPIDKEPVSTTALRPYDSHLSNKRLDEIGIDTTFVDFKSWWARKLTQ